MAVELVFNAAQNKSFSELYPFQLFQIVGSHHIYCKVNDRYARTISQETSFGRQFKPSEPVVLLIPETEEELTRRCSKTAFSLIEKYLNGGILSLLELYQIRHMTIQFVAETPVREALQCFSSGGTAEGIKEVYGIDIKETLKAYFIDAE
ncbi:hypothetical protein C7H19_15080 [Aphanothece hegewaldii CCALA 016]|uniref:Uncharacterized protein n=1 Tax=Aphanothece hegewaldii CCALA 016 TaxID=2107694 RepID=A0A2T1LVJ9_9CHRO|nr:hypothetical protein [Aphanothece hegewaldii]PSF35747.1 hypothetical protein C7H19_15080 [Aphanothece hegewaldii CCALA 016]